VLVPQLAARVLVPVLQLAARVQGPEQGLEQASVQVRVQPVQRQERVQVLVQNQRHRRLR
jgi:hypothetical protein